MSRIPLIWARLLRHETRSTPPFRCDSHTDGLVDCAQENGRTKNVLPLRRAAPAHCRPTGEVCGRRCRVTMVARLVRTQVGTRVEAVADQGVGLQEVGFPFWCDRDELRGRHCAYLVYYRCFYDLLINRTHLLI